MWIGAAVGVADALAIAVHLNVAGVSWIVSVALAKFALVAAGGLMTGGAVLRRLALRRDARRLESGQDR